MKKTPKCHPDYKDLVDALEKVQDTTRYVNDRASEADQLAKVYTIQNQIEGKSFEVSQKPKQTQIIMLQILIIIFHPN